MKEVLNMSGYDVNTMSRKDVIDALKRYKSEVSEEHFESILYFVSELTGMSVDAICEHL